MTAYSFKRRFVHPAFGGSELAVAKIASRYGHVLCGETSVIYPSLEAAQSALMDKVKRALFGTETNATTEGGE